MGTAVEERQIEKIVERTVFRILRRVLIQAPAIPRRLRRGWMAHLGCRRSRHLLDRTRPDAAPLAARTGSIDPDFGLEILPEFEKKLKKSIASKKIKRLKDFDDVVASLV